MSNESNIFDGVTEVIHSKDNDLTPSCEIDKTTFKNKDHNIVIEYHETSKSEYINPNLYLDNNNTVSEVIEVARSSDNNEAKLDSNILNPIEKENNILLKSKFLLRKMKTMDNDNSYAYKGVSDRIKQLNTFYSIDTENNQPSSPKLSLDHEINSSFDIKKLSIDPNFQMKMNDLYCPAPNTSISNSYNGDKLNNNKHESNSEIIEEEFSPVSDTAKHLEKQLSFSSSPKSIALSPRIPKMSRFARLNRFLSEIDVPEDLLSQADSNE